ncbi:hypothetical protein B0H13DRAFT_1873264 [Mycena leptocephala]|nr:hypothetical protein B0H13DRAFT_1873264 [Mycena leptocephala]
MSENAPYKRTRVFLACLNCRKRKIKCLTEDSDNRPCERCVRKGLLCQYLPVADEQDQSPGMNSPALDRAGTAQSAHQPVSHAGPGFNPYAPAGNHLSPHSRNPPYAPSTSQAAPHAAPNHGGQQFYAGSSPYYVPLKVTTPMQHGSSVYPTNYVYPSNWPAFPQSQSPTQSVPHAFAQDRATVANAEHRLHT